MRITALHNTLTGEWVGTSRLWRNWLPNPETISESSLSVYPVAGGKFLAFAYTWSIESEAHEGILLIGNENETDTVSGSWGDSWHQSGTLMSLTGTAEEVAGIALNGTFAATLDQDWGWRIAISKPTLQQLRIAMHVIPWNESEQIAVQADYTRI